MKKHLSGRILNAAFGHPLPSEYGEFLQRQLELGDKVMRQLFGNDLGPFGFVAEFDIRPEHIGIYKEALREGKKLIILGLSDYPDHIQEYIKTIDRLVAWVERTIS
ncbi:MAG: hypothetical protein ABIG89_00110 [Candidatus Woesearchaeota archaeon]